MDTAAAVLAEMDGKAGLQTLTFAPATGRYILISQTGTGTSHWWSVHDLTATCQ